MPPKPMKRAIKDALDDLSEEQVKGFCSALLDLKEEPRVRQADVERKCRLDIAGVLVQKFTDKAGEVAMQALGEIGCNAQKESLAEALGEGSVASAAPVSRFGNIMLVETTGASEQTAQQDKLKYSGVKASYAMAETDLIEMNKYKTIIQNVARQKGLEPALIAALISRSCRAGKTLTAGQGCYDEKRKAYNTFGLMQLDVNPKGGGHIPKGEWNSEEHLCQATDILLGFMLRIKHAFPDWTKEQQLKGGIAAYHAGDGNIHSYEWVDANTWGGDYSNDVIARAQWYKSEAEALGEGSVASVAPVSRFGNIMLVETTGASQQTAQQDKLKYSGVKASYAMAETDLIEMNKYKTIIQNVARQKGLEPALIAALISRSCRAGKTLTAGQGCYDEKRKAYNTFGLMQLDVNPKGGGHIPKGEWNSEEHLCQATDILLGFMLRIKHAFPDWTKEQQLKGGIAAYHAGDGNIHSYEWVDANTWGGDYSNDVIARAQWYKSEGGF